jgi:hypothetical protein
LLGKYSSSYPIAVSTDWYIEDSQNFNENSVSTSLWWHLYKRSTGWYLNAMKIGNYTVALTDDKLDLFTWDLQDDTNGIVPFTSQLTNPWLTSNTWWTVWSWWTTWANGATHTSGTAVLSQNISFDDSAWIRVSINITWWTTGTIQYWDGVKSDHRDWWYTYVWRIPTWSTSGVFEITPSTSFNWTITYASVAQYRKTRIEEWKVTITSATSHHMLLLWRMLYIWSLNKIDAIDTLATTPYSLDATYSLLESWQTIVSMQQIWQSIVIFSTDWEDSKISYRDWVSGAILEWITIKDKVITNALSDGNLSYVLCESTTKKELYIMSW